MVINDKHERAPEQLRGIIEFARGAFRNDGAEGESVHALCDALEAYLNRYEPIEVGEEEYVNGYCEEMTESEREEQRRSFAFGNCSMSNPHVTREMIDRAAEQLNDY